MTRKIPTKAAMEVEAKALDAGLQAGNRRGEFETERLEVSRPPGTCSSLARAPFWGHNTSPLLPASPGWSFRPLSYLLYPAISAEEEQEAARG